MNKKILTYGLVGVGLVASGIVGTVAFADGTDVVDQVNITVPVSCTMSGTGMNTHNAEIANGVYRADIGTTTLHAFCNDNSGFAIYAAGYTGNEIGGTNSNKLVGTAASNNATIDTGLATSAGNPDVSNWAMKLAITQDSGDTTTNAFTIDSAPNTSGGADASFSQYHVVPNEYTKVAHKNSYTDMTASTGGVKLTTTYAVYISRTQTADTYSGQVIYTLVHPATEPAPIVCKPSGTTITTIACMQDITSTNKSTVLSSMTVDQQYTLTDKRDGKSYTVAKLQDGNIWMTQNLDLDLDEDTTYTNLDTDLGWNSSTNTYDTASWTPASSTKATGDTTWTTGSAGYTIPESYDPGDLYWNGTAGYYSSESACTSAGGTWDSTNSLCNLISSTGSSHYHLGNFYNWTAAVAMNDSSSYTTNNQDVNQSICPSGWTLPKSGNNTFSGSFQYLFTQYGWSSYQMTDPYIWNTAIKLPLSGYWYGALNGVGVYGAFWSSVVRSSNYAYDAYASYGGYVSPDDYGSRGYGNSVRCIARQQR